MDLVKVFLVALLQFFSKNTLKTMRVIKTFSSDRFNNVGIYFKVKRISLKIFYLTLEKNPWRFINKSLQY